MQKEFDNYGRKIIYTDAKEINESNIINVLQDALLTHSQNRDMIKYLLDYEKGKMPILNRTKDIRPEINEKVSDNMASEITEFKLGYEWGSPITYIQRAKIGINQNNEKIDNESIAYLNDMMKEECKDAKDQELARYIEICGVGYRMIRPKQDVTGKSVFDVITLNPLSTFIVYSNDIYKQPLMGVTYSILNDGSVHYGCYTKDTYYEIESLQKIKSPGEVAKYSIVNGQGIRIIPEIIPIVEYMNDYDRMGCFEKVIPLIDALNVVQSDRVNDIVQCVQSLLWMHNAEIPVNENGESEAYSGMILQTKSTGNGNDPKLQYLSKEMSQDGIQTLATNFVDRIREITCTPGSQNNSGGSTGSAVTLSNLWQNAENMARKKEAIIRQSEMQILKIVLSIVKVSQDVPEKISKLQLSDIDIKPNRNKTYDLSTKANAITALIKTGFDPLKVLDAIPFFADNQQTYNDSQDRIDKLLFKENKKDTESEQDNKNLADYSDQPSKLEYGDTN